jgi:hypothetical protein
VENQVEFVKAISSKNRWNTKKTFADLNGLVGRKIQGRSTRDGKEIYYYCDY